MDSGSFYYYLIYWLVVQQNVCLAVTSLFQSNGFLGEENSTVINLIPNVENPSRVDDYRHMSCCNVQHKCISKILAKDSMAARMK